MSKKVINVTCSKCNSPYTVAESTFNENKRKHREFMCKSCRKEWQRQRMIARNNSMSEDEKKSFYNKVSKARKAYWKNMNEDVKKDRLQIINNANKRWRENITPEEKLRISKLHSESNIRRWNNMTIDEKEAWAQMTRDRWNAKNESEKNKWGNDIRARWQSYTPDQRAKHIHDMICPSKNINSFNQSFIVLFNNSDLSNHYTVKPEVLTQYCGKKHYWDYGIYDLNGTLNTVIDMDGEYYHADKNDYDGMHSKEEYDLYRGYTVSPHVKIFIVYENKIQKCFDRLCQILPMDAKTYADELLKQYYMIPFPVPTYTNEELDNSYSYLVKMNCNDMYHNEMSLNTRIGDHIIYHFHPSIWDNSLMGVGPHSIWDDKELLIDMIYYHILYHTPLNKNKILQGFIAGPDISKPIPFLSPGKVKMIINKYLKAYNFIFEPIIGFGGILLATLSLDKEYLGFTASDEMYNETSKMIDYVSPYTSTTAIIAKELYTLSYPCIMQEVISDDQISLILETFTADIYVFISLTSSEKYKDQIVDKFISNYNEYSIIIINS